jgi:hypothetical protein
MKGMPWESPRGPISIDPRTRGIVQNVYIRKVEKVNGAPWAIEFETFPNVKEGSRDELILLAGDVARFCYAHDRTPPVSGCGTPVVLGSEIGSPRRLRTAR